MKLDTKTAAQAACLIASTALWIAAFPAGAQMSPASPPSAGSPMASMDHAGMKHSMMSGMEHMQKMTMTGDTDKDFATMMKMHHQQGVDMAQREIAHGKSPAMIAMAKKIVAAQKREIAELDAWLAKQK